MTRSLNIISGNIISGDITCHITCGRHHQRGFVLLPVILLIALLASVILLLTRDNASGASGAASAAETTKAQYVAEAGFQHALWQARQAKCSGYTDIVDKSFGDHSYSVTVTPTDGSPVTFQSTAALAGGANLRIQRAATTVYSAASTQSVKFQPGSEGDDAEIWDQRPNDNYGDSNETWVSSASGDTTRSLLRFNLGAIPAGAIILEATLFLTRQSGSGSASPVSAHRIINSWSEDSVSWNLRELATNWDVAGSDFDANAVTTTPVGPVNQRYDWNITPLVQGWVDGSYPNYGVVLAAAIAGMTGERFYTSDESNPDRRPGLSVTYACECGQPCASASSAPKDVLLVVGDPANLTTEQADKQVLMEGWGHSITLISTGESQAAFDAAAALVDVVYIPELGATPTSELGNKADNLAVGVITEEARTAIKLGSFSLFPFIDAASINIVDNTHYLTEALPTGNVALSTVTQSFWKLAGTLAPDLHVLGEFSGSVPGLAYVDVGETVNDGNPAAGRRVKLPWGSYSFDVSQLTPEALDIMQRAIEWGGTTAAPGGPYKILFVVANDTGLTTEELAHKAHIESWGHTVELIDDDATPTEFNTAVINNDVAFTTNDITASRLDTKLVDATIGVVTSEVNLSDELGLSSSVAWDSGTVIEINDNTHYITSPFPPGTLTYSSTNESLAYVTGTLSPDLGQLASSSSGYGVVTLESGETMYGGGPVAGRRVQLPWGGAGFDPDNLTPEGLTILKRALEWGATIPQPPVCDGNFSANSQVAQWDTSSYGPVSAIAYIPGGVPIGGTPLPVTGGWAIRDSIITSKVLFVDTAGNLINEMTLSTGNSISGLSYVDSGLHAGKLALFDSGTGQLLLADLTGNVTTTWNLGLTTSKDVTFIGTGSYADHFVVSSDAHSDVVNDTGVLVGTVVYPAGVDSVKSIVHIPGGDLVAVGDNTDKTIYIMELTGALPTIAATVVNQFDFLQFGISNATKGLGFDPFACQYSLPDSTNLLVKLVDDSGGGGGGGGSCDGTLRDEFNATNFSGSDGTLTWAEGWLEVGESDGATSGDTQITNDASNYQLRTQDNNNGGEGVEREADLSGAGSATLSYEYRRVSLDNANDYTSVEVSANGTSGPWTELTRHAGSGTDPDYVSASHDISSFSSANTRIRFKTSSNMGNSDRVWFDNIEISCAP